MVNTNDLTRLSKNKAAIANVKWKQNKNH